jgi:LysR family transcriptional regulator, glycine cleavage system transcriptional activator
MTARRLPPLHGLAAFEAVARLRSFTQAADELCITRSAVSHRLRELEERLGVTLIDRNARPLALTPAGASYLSTVRDALDAVAGAAQAVPRDAAQRIVVASPPTFARQILVPRLADFHRAHEGVEVAVELAIPLHDLQPAGVDIEIRFGRGLYPEFVTLSLLDEPVFPVCAPSYAARVTLRAPADLEHATLLRSALEPWAPWFAAAGLRWPEPVAGSRYEDLAMLYQAASDGEGVALARPSLVGPALDRGVLQRLFDVAAHSPHAYYLVCRPAALGRPEVAHFVDWLRAALPVQRAR